jgi:hypothetical protein
MSNEYEANFFIKFFLDLHRWARTLISVPEVDVVPTAPRRQGKLQYV